MRCRTANEQMSLCCVMIEHQLCLDPTLFFRQFVADRGRLTVHASYRVFVTGSHNQR